ncbi:MAG: YciI family protein [Acidimicrobiia bacterium]|nr:YciI family protein [Acidimicrobiia bacterium]MDH3470877.1 YciI family protein [Acidimicrobiia bacterium]
MPKYMMIYKGEATDMSDMTPEQGAEVMAKWGAWMEKVGPALSDIGTPFGPGASKVDDGSSGDSVPLTGYSIVEAADMSAAKALTEGHPYLSEGKGDFAIQLHELLPVPFEA